MTELVTIQTKQHLTGPRQLNPNRDLPAVADLIEEAFSEDLDQEGRQVLSELRQLGRWGMLLWLLRYMTPTFEDILSGFVWEQDGEIIGNVSVNVVNGWSARWRISNVAVAPQYRKRGIARQLMESTIQHIQRRGGRTVYLQVRDDNLPAVKLYRNLNFQPIAAETEMYLKHIDSISPADDLRPRSPHHNDGPDLYALALAATPKIDQQLAPLSQVDFEVDWFQQLSDMLTAVTSGQRIYRFVVDGKRGLAGYARLIATRRRGIPHRFSLLVHPDYEGRVEKGLVGAVLRTLQSRYSGGEVRIKLNAKNEAEIEALTSLGFVKHRTLVMMELHLAT